MPFAGEFHGTSGPVRTSFNDNLIPVETDIIKACDEVTGYSKKPLDPWSGDHIGFYNTLGSIARTGPNKGKRSYAARGYYENNRSTRPNLKVLCSALINKVVLEGNKAVGVNFTHNDQEHTITTNREIIVSGGTLKSPQILELSGIGDPAVLEAAGVECKVANPAIGNNLQDHPITIAGYECQPGIMTLDSLYQNPELMAAAQKQYAESQSGVLSCTSSMQGFFSAKSIMSEEELEEVVQSIRDVKPTSEFHQKQLEQIIAHLQNDVSANLQMVLVPISAALEGIEHQSKLFAPTDLNKPAGLTFALCLQYPVARGSVHIDSAGMFFFFVLLWIHPSPSACLSQSTPTNTHPRPNQTPQNQPQLRRPRSRHRRPGRRLPLGRQSAPITTRRKLTRRTNFPPAGS